MSSSFADFLENKLRKQNESGLRRTLKRTPPDLVDFSSNDYLGLAASEAIAKLAAQFVAEHGNRNGSTGSRLLTGNSEFAEDTESLLSNVFKSEAGLLFNSGYVANVAVLSSLPQKNDTVLYDEFAHASIKDGARLALARRFSFRHNDPEDLETKLKKAEGRSFVVVESIYSMDGDRCPLREIALLVRKYDGVLVLDEAHSTGMYAEGGAGLAVAQGLHDLIDVRVYTFGKAIGAHGAFVAGSTRLREYLINFARPFIYTTAMTPHSVATIMAAFVYLRENFRHFRDLEANIRTYGTLMEDGGNTSVNDTAIQTVLFPGNAEARDASIALNRAGFDVRPILSPTVPAGKERLRICLHSFNTENEIRELVSQIRNLRRKAS